MTMADLRPTVYCSLGSQSGLGIVGGGEIVAVRKPLFPFRDMHLYGFVSASHA